MILSIFATLSAFAAVSPTPPPAQPAPHAWFCTADGYDFGNQLRSISGDLKRTRKEAAWDAVKRCQGFYMGCSVRGCFQEY